jgi:hypothetical protein
MLRHDGVGSAACVGRRCRALSATSGARARRVASGTRGGWGLGGSFLAAGPRRVRE